MTTIERPGEEEMGRLEAAWHPGARRRFACDLRRLDERIEKPECKGEAVIVVQDGDGRVLMVRHPGNPVGYWKLPQGRIEFGETVEEGALREAKEETGHDVRIAAMPAVHEVRYDFMGCSLERWHFIFLCEIAGGGPLERDTAEIAEVSFERLDDCARVWKPFDAAWIPQAVADATGRSGKP